MVNPLIDEMNRRSSPMAILESNPATKALASMIKNGANPKNLFYELCKQKGVDPDSILNQLKKGGENNGR